MSTTDPLCLHVMVVSANGLAQRSNLGKSDPYVRLRLVRGKKNIEEFVTKTKKKTAEPQWNELIVFKSAISTENDTLLLDVYDENKLTRDNFLGRLQFTLRQIPIQNGNPSVYPLKTKPSSSFNVSGTLSVKLLYYNDPPTARSTNSSISRSSSTVAVVTQQLSTVRVDGAADDPQLNDSIMENVEPLPEGWEERQMANGRVVYVDHRNRRTQWERPTVASQRQQASHVDNERRRMAYTLARRNPGDEASHAKSPGVRPVSMSDVASTSQEGNRPVRAHSQRSTSTSLQVQQEEELPPGWEKRLDDSGRVFYIDHTRRVTQWHPPSTQPRPQILQDLGPLPPGWEVRSSSDGKKFYIDHNTRSTQWEDPRVVKLKKQQLAAMPYSRDYKQKYENLKQVLLSKKPENLPKTFEIPVRRGTLFEDSHRAIMSVKNKDHMKARLWVKFDGEVGLDYGGVAREWFCLLSHEIFNPYYGLFEYATSDNYTLQINANSGVINEQHLDYFRFAGRVIGLAIYHQKLIDAFFTRPFYKLLLDKPVNLSDMQSMDMEMHNSVQYILDNDPEDLCLTFTVTKSYLGKLDEIPLKPNGQDIPVTEENKKEYVNLLLKWHFGDRISNQMDAIKKGISDLIPLRCLQVFDEREIEYLLCGLAEINVEDWRRNSAYANGYQATDDVIVWFWKAVENFDVELRARLLQFVTGTSRVPMNGFAELQGSNGPQKFCIKKLGDPTSLPRAHTCFNRIDLPPYTSYHELKEKLRLAIENTEGFEGVD
ncbi:hypothetical protein EMCRGX_G021957 [Ephydatia muelleri]